MESKKGKGRIKKWLKEKAPHILEKVGDVLPDSGYLGIIKGLISSDDILDQKSKEEALKLIELDSIELNEITKRWESDNKADSWLAKNTRPLAFLIVLNAFIIYAFLDGFQNIKFTSKIAIISVFEAILITMVIAYYGSRGYEKANKEIQKRKIKENEKR